MANAPSASFFSPYDANAETSQLAIARQRAFAQQLMDSSHNDTLNQPVSGIVLRQNPLIPLSDALKGSLGGVLSANADANDVALRQQALGQAVNNFAGGPSQSTPNPVTDGTNSASPSTDVSQQSPVSQAGQIVPTGMNGMSRQQIAGYLLMPGGAQALLEQQLKNTAPTDLQKNLGNDPALVKTAAYNEAMGRSLSQGGQVVPDANGNPVFAPMQGYAAAQADIAGQQQLAKTNNTIFMTSAGGKEGVPVTGAQIMAQGNSGQSAPAQGNLPPPINSATPIPPQSNANINMNVQPQAVGAPAPVTSTGDPYQDYLRAAGQNTNQPTVTGPPIPQSQVFGMAPGTTEKAKAGIAYQNEINDNAETALKMKANLAELGGLRQDFTPSKAAGVQQAIAQWKVAGGIASPEDVQLAAATEGVDKQAAQLASNAIKSMSSRGGTQMEFKTFLGNLPNKEMTPQGFDQILQFMNKTNDIPIQKQQQFAEYAKDKYPQDYQNFDPIFNKQLNDNMGNIVTNNNDPERQQAQQAISAGVNPDLVKQHYQQRTGKSW